MKICPKCGKQYSIGNFCEDCEDENGAGVKLVEGKVCENCGHVVPQGFKRCTNCGVALTAKSTEGVGLGDKNVIAGDINSTIHHNENIVDNTVLHNESYTNNYNSSNQVYNTNNNITNTSTTNIINQDETKKMVRCHICGKHIVITNAITCRKCGNVICTSCFNDVDKSCIECSSSMIVPKGISSHIREFSQELQELDREIAYERENNINNSSFDLFSNSNIEKKWWDSWKLGKKIMYVILNIYTFAIPVILHFLILALKKGIPVLLKTLKKDALTISEKEKRTLIENLIVDNSKDEIIEFLNIAKLQREIALNENNRNSLIWLNVWTAKTNQVINKAKSFYSSDATFMFYIKKQQADCKKDQHNLRSKLLIKSLGIKIPVLLIIAAIIAGIISMSKKTIKSVPSETIITAENIKVLGFFEDYMSVSPDGATLKYRPNDKKIEIIFSLIPNSDGAIIINKQINNLIANKKWKKEDCIYEIYDYCNFYINNENVSDLTGDRNCKKSFADLYSMKKGEPVKFDLLLDLSPSTFLKSSLMKQYAEFMNSDYLEINPKLKYKVQNKAENITEYLDFSEL